MAPRRKRASKKSDKSDDEIQWLYTISTEPELHLVEKPASFNKYYKPSKNGFVPRKTRSKKCQKSPSQKTISSDNPFNLFLLVDGPSVINCPGKKVSYKIHIEEIVHEPDSNLPQPSTVVPQPPLVENIEKEDVHNSMISEDEGYIVTDEDLWREHTYEDILSLEDYCETMLTDEEMELLHPSP